jgi:nicotinate-nucleotide adenylyltransferase
MNRIGLLGGSFNPAHRGHRQISILAARELGLDEVWWLVSPANPLKDEAELAPFDARFASAMSVARGAPIRVTAIETELDTRFTLDTLIALRRRFPQYRFIWMMGADNLAQFHRWRGWRRIATLVPIAVIGRPGYDARAHSVRAMGWLRRFVRRPDQARNWTEWRPPALVLLDLPPDPTSATALRAAEPHWHRQLSFNVKGLRDGVTRRPLA